MNNIIQTDFGDYCENSYLAYSMYVVLDRALPHISDGLKPVQRRIIYAMSELGLDSTAKHKKSARTVGDVLGKYHPHGDSACYGAMALMSQDFSYRYPLIDGQGNWGSRDDPKSFAAMRYTEARLGKYAKHLLTEIKYDTVDWKPNFDGTMNEPATLPAKVPNILINGTSGIAVGMSTDIPSHNLCEVISATIALIRDGEIGVSKLMEHVSGPDMPTQAEIITPREQLERIYQTGRGSFKMRATYHSEGEKDIVIDALPHLVSGEKVLEYIGSLLQKKALPMVENLRDESDHEHPTRLIIEVKRNSGLSHVEIMDHLFAQTDLEKNYRVNLNVLGLDGKPKVMNLKEILGEWITYRKITVRRKLNHHLDKINSRLHLIEGLLIAYANLDRIIQIIRESDTPKEEMIEAFGLSDLQASAIMEIRLRQLAKLEESKLRDEESALLKDKAKIEDILGSEQKLNKYLIHEMEKIMKEDGDDRLSAIVARESAKPLSAETLVSSEPVTVVLSDKGWIKMAKGHNIDAENLNYKTGDELRQALKTNQDRPTVAISEKGKSFHLPTHQLPSARSHGDHITKYIALKEGDRIRQIHDIQDKRYLLASSIGYGFITPGEEFDSKKRAGKQIINVGDGAMLTIEQMPDSDTHIIVITKMGYVNVFPSIELPELKKGKGNKLISLTEGDEVVYVSTLNIDEQTPYLVNGSKVELYRDSLGRALGKRGRRGQKIFSPITAPILKG